MMKKGCGAHCVAWTLVMIGAINWGLVGLFEFNLVEAIFGGMPALERVIYVVVGVSALFMLMDKRCKMCVQK